jgi:hypothetical protein
MKIKKEWELHQPNIQAPAASYILVNGLCCLFRLILWAGRLTVWFNWIRFIPDINCDVTFSGGCMNCTSCAPLDLRPDQFSVALHHDH